MQQINFKKPSTTGTWKAMLWKQRITPKTTFEKAFMTLLRKNQNERLGLKEGIWGKSFFFGLFVFVSFFLCSTCQFCFCFFFVFINPAISVLWFLKFFIIRHHWKKKVPSGACRLSVVKSQNALSHSLL